MAMNVEDWNELIKEALEKSEDAATVVSVLTRARDEYAGTYSELVAANEQAATNAAEVDRLKQTNMELFLRVGQSITQEGKKEESETPKDRADTITIKDLFNIDKKED